MNEQEIQQLVKTVRAGVQAEEQLTNLFWQKIYNFATRFEFAHEEIVDIVHETICAMLFHLRNQEFRGEASFETFVIGIGKHICLDQLKKIKQKKKTENIVPFSIEEKNSIEAQFSLYGDPAQLQHIHEKEEEELLKRCFDTIFSDKEEWAIFTLLAKSYGRKEISDLLDIPLERVDKKIHYGKKKLQQYVQSLK